MTMISASGTGIEMNLLQEISAGLPDARVEQIGLGSHWAAVVVARNGDRRCGLASNPVKGSQVDEVLQTGLRELESCSALDICSLVADLPLPLPSVSLAAINALLPLQPERWGEGNAGEAIARKGHGKRVALVGHFPFVNELREQVEQLDVLELRPREGDIPASEAPRIIPQADVVAITSMAFVNGTMAGLLELCSPDAYVIVLGPSTPLSPLLFDHGIDMLCGSIVNEIEPVLEGVMNGNSFHQIRQQGVRLVTIEK